MMEKRIGAEARAEAYLNKYVYLLKGVYDDLQGFLMNPFLSPSPQKKWNKLIKMTRM